MGAATLHDLRTRLDAAPGIPALAFHGADLRGADLRGANLSCLSLRGVLLDDADLRGASLSHVDLSNASLIRARLAGATLQMVSLAGASLRGIAANESRWDVADLSAADFTDGDVREAVFRGCLLERATADRMDLSGGRLDFCNCTDASFREVRWQGASTGGSRFRGADLAGGRRFFQCRELVAHVLDPLVDAGPEEAAVVGAVAVDGNQCYPEWAAYLAGRPDHRARATDVFGRYPDSGIAEALRLADRRGQA